MTMRRKPLVAALLVLLAVGATACIEGRPAPEPTAMVDVETGLTFVFGDDGLCQDATDAERLEATCDIIRNPTGSVTGYSVAPFSPTATVTIRPFAIDVHEVTNVQYQYCVERGGCTELEGFNSENITEYYRNGVYDDYPVGNVTWEQARDYCQFVGKRLPTQFEWERVAGGGATTPADKRRFPFGADFQAIEECQGTGIPVAYCGAERRPVPADRGGPDSITENGVTLSGFGGNLSEWVVDYRVTDFTCRDDLQPECPDCLGCGAQDTTCKQQCYACDACWDAGDSCYVLCEAPAGSTDEHRGYPACFRYDEPLYCALNADGESECCLGDFADAGGTDCEVARPADQARMHRGGSFGTSGSDTCTLRTGDRSQGWPQDDQRDKIGFRCATSL